MLLGFKEMFNGKPTDFVGKILIHDTVLPGRDYDQVSSRPDVLRVMQEVLAGQKLPKLHTLREDPEGRWETGKTAHLCVGQRTKHCLIFGEALITGVQGVELVLTERGTIDVLVEGMRLTNGLKALFVAHDGFDRAEEFEAWFRPVIEEEVKAGREPVIKRRLIHWGEVRY